MRRLRPSPQAISMPCLSARKMVPGAAAVSPPITARKSLQLRPSISAMAQGQGCRPRIWQWMALAGRLQSTGDMAFVSMGA